jgi:hypothetical protein
MVRKTGSARGVLVQTDRGDRPAHPGLLTTGRGVLGSWFAAEGDT